MTMRTEQLPARELTEIPSTCRTPTIQLKQELGSFEEQRLCFRKPDESFRKPCIHVVNNERCVIPGLDASFCKVCGIWCVDQRWWFELPVKAEESKSKKSKRKKRSQGFSHQ
jgi:hypothetical protein